MNLHGDHRVVTFRKVCLMNWSVVLLLCFQNRMTPWNISGTFYFTGSSIMSVISSGKGREDILIKQVFFLCFEVEWITLSVLPVSLLINEKGMLVFLSIVSVSEVPEGEVVKKKTREIRCFSLAFSLFPWLIG